MNLEETIKRMQQSSKYLKHGYKKRNEWEYAVGYYYGVNYINFYNIIFESIMKLHLRKEGSEKKMECWAICQLSSVLFAHGRDKKLFIWNINCKEVNYIYKSKGLVCALASLPNCTLVVGDRLGQLSIHDIKARSCIKLIQIQNISSILYIPLLQKLLCGAGKQLLFYDVKTWQQESSCFHAYEASLLEGVQRTFLFKSSENSPIPPLTYATITYQATHHVKSMVALKDGTIVTGTRMIIYKNGECKQMEGGYCYYGIALLKGEKVAISGVSKIIIYDPRINDVQFIHDKPSRSVTSIIPLTQTKLLTASEDKFIRIIDIPENKFVMEKREVADIEVLFRRIYQQLNQI